MAVFTKTFVQDLKGCMDVQITEGLVFSADNDSLSVSVAVYDGGEAATLTGSVVVYVIRADGNTVAFSGTLSGNVASAVLPQSCFVIPGPIAVMLQIVSGDVRTTVLKAIFTAVPSSTGAIIDPGHVIPDIADIIAMLDDLEEAIADAEAATSYIAPTETSPAETAHSIGEYIIYNGSLCRVTAPISIGDTLTDGTNIVIIPGGLGATVSNIDCDIDTLTNNALIELDTDKAFSHNNLNYPQAITFYGNSLAFKTARYCNAQNLFPNATKNWTASGVSMSASGHFLTYNSGSSSSATNTKMIETAVSLPAGNYKFIMESSASISNNVGRTILQCQYEGSSSWTDLKSVFASNNYTANVTADNAIKKLRLYVPIHKDYTYSGEKRWFGLYDAAVEIVDTEQTVSDGNTYDYASGDLQPLSTIDTMQHQSEVAYIEKTKKYVDEHTPDIIGFWTENVYVLPENFGAVGDGVTDDTTALGNCMTYAVTHNKAVRGYGKYKTSTAVTLGTRYADVFLREVIYSGNQTAVSIENTDIVFAFHRIESAGIGISFGGSNPYARRCQVKGNEIKSESHCIEVKDLTLYSTVEVRYLNSTSGDCIHRTYGSTFGGNEFVYRSSACHCPNGYVANGITSSKFYDLSIESDCKYGFLNPENCVCMGIRHREQTDAMALRITQIDTTRTNGPLIKFTLMPATNGCGFVYISSDPIPWCSIDTSAIQTYETVPSGTGNDAIWDERAYTGIELGTPISGMYNNKGTIIGERAYFISGFLVCAPNEKSETVIDQDVDFRLFDSNVEADINGARAIVKYLVTDFVIGTTHADITFNAFFGAVGYNDLTVTQANGNTCTITDKLGNTIFDGTNAGNGKWSMKCVVDRTSFGEYPTANRGWWKYDGTNEKWIVTKLE